MFISELMPTAEANLTFVGEDKQTREWKRII